MTINIDFVSKNKLSIKYRAICKKVVEKVLEFEGCPYEAEVSVLIADDDYIKALNNEFREINKTTDVLSFPAINFKKPSDFKFLNNNSSYFNPETKELVLGDIALSVNKILNQAEEYGHSVKREYAFLITHSMLHLLGYDHIDDKDRMVMEKRQEEILLLLGINR